MTKDIAESIPGLVRETLVVVIGDDTFPAAYDYRGLSRDGEHQWLGIGMDEYESVPEWDEEGYSRILAVFLPPGAGSQQPWYPVFGRYTRASAEN